MEDDWFVKRFLLARGRKIEPALNMIVETLKWRKREGFASISPNYFPAEFYHINAMFSYEPDKQGNIAIHIRIKYILRCGPLVAHAVKWASKFFYDLDSHTECAFYTVVIDFADCGIKNAEIEFVRHAISILKNYIPASLKNILLLDLPKVLRFAYGLVKGWIPESGRNVLHFVSRNDLTNFFDPQNLPDYLGGTCTRPYQGPQMVPEGCPSAVEYGYRVGLTVDQCLKVAMIYEPVVKSIGLYQIGEDDLVVRVAEEIKCLQEGKPLSGLKLSAQATA